MMLVISRKEKQTIQIDEKTTVIVNAIKGNTVTLGFEAPRDVRIVRGELLTDASRNKEWERQ
jgi:carbon storage regulator